MKVKDVKDKCQIGDTIITKRGYIGNSNIPNSIKFVITKIEEKGNSIRLYFDLTKLTILNQGIHNRYQNVINQYGTNNLQQIKNNLNFLGYTILQGFVTASYVEKIIKDPNNIKSTVEIFKDNIYKHQVRIKDLLNLIEKEKDLIKEIENRMDFITKFNLKTFDDKKYKAYKLIDVVSKINDGKTTSEMIDEVAKLV